MPRPWGQLTDPITAELYSRDEDKLYRLVHDYFKRLLIEWEDDLGARPGWPPLRAVG